MRHTAVLLLAAFACVVVAADGLQVILTSLDGLHSGRTEEERLTDLANAIDVINAARYGRSDVTLHVYLVAPGKELQEFKERTKNYNTLFTSVVQHGPSAILDKWHPEMGSTERAVFLEDDMEISEKVLWWVDSVWDSYGQRADVGAVSLESRGVKASDNEFPKMPGAVAYLYRNAGKVKAFSPGADVWRVFIEYMSQRKNRWYEVGEGMTVTDEALERAKFDGQPRPDWCSFFYEFMVDYNLFMLYPNLENGVSLAVGKRPFLTEHIDQTPEWRTVLPADWTVKLPSRLVRFDEHGQLKGNTVYNYFSEDKIDRIAEIGWQQGGLISFTVITEIFVETAHSWLCNVDYGGFRPKGIVWIVNDEIANDEMTKIPGADTVYLTASTGGQRGNEFGNPGYWQLMMERTMLLHEILERGIDIFNFETDQIWLEDPMPHVRELLNEGGELVGTLNTRKEISGNLFYMKATLGLRRAWGEVTKLFVEAYKNAKLEDKEPSSWTYIENDQSLLTKLVIRNETYQRMYPVHFLTLDTQRFVDGRWYEGEYTSKAAQFPVLINNNFMIGVQEKKKRALRFKHWFWDEWTNSCNKDNLQYSLFERKHEEEIRKSHKKEASRKKEE